MKKLFTLALALLVTFAGYSQSKSVSMKNDLRKVATMQKATRMENVNANAESQPNMVRFDYGMGELDYTAYDWQSNQGPRTWTIAWPDGTVNFAYTCASDDSYGDRGTAIGTYNSNTDEWIPLGGRIESEKTGFGSIARYKENGIVVAAHTSTNLGVYIVEDKDSMTPNSVPASIYTNNGSYTHPAVMTSGANRDIIHVFCGNFDDSSIPFKYWRSSDGQTWDKTEVILPFIEEFGSDWGTNEYYWMETSEDNCLALVINSAWCDGMVIYSYDNGETWERKVFYHHPGVHATFDTWFMYPRWTSAVWGIDGELCMAYEFNGSTGAPGSGSYYPGIGGVAFWSENMPYYGDGSSFAEWGSDPTNPMPPTPGQPFIMDSAYMFQDIYASWWLWSDATHEMWPEYMGYLPALTNEGEVEPDPYNVEEFNIEDRSLHGSYNSGCVAMPVLCKLQDSDYDLVALWCAMDENNLDGASNYYYKLFASYSGDGGRTWAPQVHITNDFMMTYTEHAYPQAAVIGNTLVVAVQADDHTGTYVQGDQPAWDQNHYSGYTYDLKDVFPEAGVGVQEVEHNNHISLYPNPAVDQLNVTLNKNAEMTIYNIMGQAVMTMEGRVGVNTIDLSNFTSGIYFISAGNDTQKFIVK
jgi:hypothetical protein